MTFFQIKADFLSCVILALVVMVICFGCSRSSPNRPRFVDPLAKLKTDLGMLEVDNGRYPTTAESLEVLLKKPSDPSITNWHGPYLAAGELKDRWGHGYIYRCPGVHNAAGYDLYSMGPDGKADTDDDIGNWATAASNP